MGRTQEEASWPADLALPEPLIYQYGSGILPSSARHLALKAAASAAAVWSAMTEWSSAMRTSPRMAL